MKKNIIAVIILLLLITAVSFGKTPIKGFRITAPALLSSTEIEKDIYYASCAQILKIRTNRTLL